MPHLRNTSRPAPAESLEEILCTEELQRRPSRTSPRDIETRVTLELTRHIAASPQAALQQLAEAAMTLTGAGSAGISVAETTPDGKRVFRWRATAGAYFPFAGSTLPRDFSPCGVTVDRNAVQLMIRPERYYPYVAAIHPPVEEVLLVPFHRHDQAVGTIWVVSHGGPRFDAEHARVMLALSRFVSSAADLLDDL